MNVILGVALATLLSTRIAESAKPPTPICHRAIGWIVLGVALAGVAAGLASFALYEGLGVISSDTSADLGILSLGAATATVMIGFALRRRARLAHDGMFVGLATLGAWFLLLMYALSQDTP